MHLSVAWPILLVLRWLVCLSLLVAPLRRFQLSPSKLRSRRSVFAFARRRVFSDAYFVPESAFVECGGRVVLWHL